MSGPQHEASYLPGLAIERVARELAAEAGETAPALSFWHLAAAAVLLDIMDRGKFERLLADLAAGRLHREAAGRWIACELVEKCHAITRDLRAIQASRQAQQAAAGLAAAAEAEPIKVVIAGGEPDDCPTCAQFDDLVKQGAEVTIGGTRMVAAAAVDELRADAVRRALAGSCDVGGRRQFEC